MNHLPNPSKETICAVVVTFNPPDSLHRTLSLLAPQVGHIIIVDNASAHLLNHANATLIANKKNEGQGMALNQGIREARRRNASWVLMMDQDSVPAPDMVEELIKAYRATKDKKRVALIGTNFTYRTSGRLAYKNECAGKVFFEREGIQISGSLLSLAAYEAIGPFRENFFIDYIDTEYCLRLADKKFKGIIACNAHMTHDLGEKGKHTATANYNALRRYYRTRNECILMREYALKKPWWTIKHAGYMIYEWSLILTTEEDRMSKISSAFLGIKDAIRKKMGKMTSHGDI